MRDGTGGGGGGVSGTGGTNTGQGGAAGATATPFVCSQIIGLTLTSEWYLAGFENGVDPTRWQLKFAQSAYVNQWANASSSFWNTAVMSPCSKNSTAPDRVILVALSWTIMAQADWEAAVTGAVNTIKLKYPAVRRIELMTIVRGPQNRSCGDPNVYAENTHIPVALDNALAKVAETSPELVKVAPKFEVSACSDFTGVGPHLTVAGNAKMAGVISAHYAQQP